MDEQTSRCACSTRVKTENGRGYTTGECLVVLEGMGVCGRCEDGDCYPGNHEPNPEGER